MGQRAKRQCAEPGCYSLTREKRCDQHKRVPTESSRPSAYGRGYGKPWQRASKSFLSREENRLCVQCKSEGRTRLSKVTDHIVPHKGDMTLFWDMDNWQGMCEQCHNRKTRRGE